MSIFERVSSSRMDRRRFLILGIDDYKWSLEAIGLHSGYSDGSSVVDSDIADGDDLLLDVILPSLDGDQVSVKANRSVERSRLKPTGQLRGLV